MKRFCADDSGRTSVKVGHRQALMPHKAPHPKDDGALCFGDARLGVPDQGARLGTPGWGRPNRSARLVLTVP